MLDNAVQPVLPFGGACHYLRRQEFWWSFDIPDILNLEPTTSSLDPWAGVSLCAGVEGVELARESSRALLRSSSSSRTVKGRLKNCFRKVKVC